MEDGRQSCSPGGLTHGRAGPVILVLERDPLIAEDIIGSLAAVCDFRVAHASRLPEFLAMLRHEAQVLAAFLELHLAKVLDTGIDRMLAEQGAGIVLTVGEDDAEQAEERGWSMLIRPFSDRMIGEALKSVLRPGAGCVRLP
ncbi:hypothetical protein [Marinovum sp.]|uniref:hypothetical protein n=1 Tax=Marinovum sp. TaxID=2024839 RepID=UPI003A8D5A3F